MRTALITGVTGQDGAYLAEYLLSKGYEVHGLKRRSSLFNTNRIEHIYQDPHEDSVSMHLHYGDMTDATNLIRLVQDVQPDEIYNLAAQSHVQVSFEMPEYTAQTNALGTLRVLEAIRILGLEKKVRFFQASTSEMYGDTDDWPQDESTPFRPCSPYGIAKVFSYWTTVNYRKAYGFHASNGILFNHESPVRGETFVTRKISRGLARIKAGLQDRLFIGNLDARRDWGHAADYVVGMWLALQRDCPDDYVFATGNQYSVRDFINRAGSELGFEVVWQGCGATEKGVDGLSGRTLVEVDPRYFRPSEVNNLCGNPAKARSLLGWKSSRSLGELIREMVHADYEKAKRDALVKEAGYDLLAGR